MLVVTMRDEQGNYTYIPADKIICFGTVKEKSRDARARWYVLLPQTERYWDFVKTWKEAECKVDLLHHYFLTSGKE